MNEGILHGFEGTFKPDRIFFDRMIIHVLGEKAGFASQIHRFAYGIIFTDTSHYLFKTCVVSVLNCEREKKAGLSYLKKTENLVSTTD
jgi:hypothetical protein